MFVSKMDLIHLASRNFWDVISSILLRLTSCTYCIILIQNLPILGPRRPNYVLKTYTNVTDITGWWNSICNSKWVNWTSKTNTSIFQNRNAKKAENIKKKLLTSFAFQKMVEPRHKNYKSSFTKTRFPF